MAKIVSSAEGGFSNFPIYEYKGEHQFYGYKIIGGIVAKGSKLHHTVGIVQFPHGDGKMIVLKIRCLARKN